MVATQLGAMRVSPAPIPRCWRNTANRSGRAIWRRRSSVLNRRCPYRGWRFRAVEREDQLIHLPPVLAVTTPESADAARLGVGVARLLYYQALDGLRCGNCLLLESVEPEPAPVHLLYTARELAPLKLRNLSILPRRRCASLATHCRGRLMRRGFSGASFNSRGKDKRDGHQCRPPSGMPHGSPRRRRPGPDGSPLADAVPPGSWLAAAPRPPAAVSTWIVLQHMGKDAPNNATPMEPPSGGTESPSGDAVHLRRHRILYRQHQYLHHQPRPARARR